MKLESYWLFKEIILMFSYILVVSRGYILSISICPMLKIEKLPQGGKYMVAFFCSTVQKFHWLFCVGNLDSWHWVDFKIESVLLKPRRKKIKFYNSLRNGSKYSQTVDSW